MTAPVPFGPYSGVQPYVKATPAYAPPKDKDRIASYAIYRHLYWTHVDEAYKVMNRGLDSADEPVYVPSSRIVIDTMNRYIGTGLTFAVDVTSGTEASQLAANQALTDLFARERFYSRYNASKHDGLIVGDWGWHVVADPDKPEGRRISLLRINPDSLFTTYEDELVDNGDPDKLMQVRLVELVEQDDKTLSRVQLYDKWNDGNPDGLIYSSVTLWKEEEWYDDSKHPVNTLAPPAPLPAAITSFPVYHIPNGENGQGGTFGSSEIRGLETLQAALNQSVTDEDLALALMGLGVYGTTEPGNPTNAKGETTDWFVYPGMVIQNSHGLHKIEGIDDIGPYTEHVKRLEGYLADATGATDAARGRLEVTEAESGIALQLKLAPTLAKAAEKDQIILDVHNQMFYDLVQMWLPTFENVNVKDVRVTATLGDKLPINRKAEAELVSGLVVAQIMSKASARKYLVGRGFAGMFDPREGELVLAEMVAEAQAAQSDPALDKRSQLEDGNPDDTGVDTGGE